MHVRGSASKSIYLAGVSMYVSSLSIKNIRAISNFKFEVKATECAGWHVILGDNGSGKSSLIKSLAIIFAGGPKVSASRQIWEDWLSQGCDRGEIEVIINRDDSFDQYVLKGRQPGSYTMRATIERDTRKLASGAAAEVSISFNSQNSKTAERTIWANGNGWFSSSFGPFRRFSGGDRDWDRLFVSPEYRRIAAHLSAFGEDVAFTEALYWLQQLKVSSLENPSSKSGQILEAVKNFVNSAKLLPHGSHIADITTKAVTLRDAAGATIVVDQMSDGYRSVLSLTFELLRQMFLSFGDDIMLRALTVNPGNVDVPGVVAIDEIDAHLHPTWQTRIGDWFVDHFPRVQFIITTHSPLVCRAAKRGSIWRLPTPGSNDSVVRVQGQDFDRLVQGNILEAFGTDYFGKDIDVPQSSKEVEQQIARLSMLKALGRLSPEQDEVLRTLQAARPTIASKIA